MASLALGHKLGGEAEKAQAEARAVAAGDGAQSTAAAERAPGGAARAGALERRPRSSKEEQSFGHVRRVEKQSKRALGRRRR